MWTDNDGVTHLEPQDLDKRYHLVQNQHGRFALAEESDSFAISRGAAEMPGWPEEQENPGKKAKKKPRLARWQDIRGRK